MRIKSFLSFIIIFFLSIVEASSNISQGDYCVEGRLMRYQQQWILTANKGTLSEVKFILEKHEQLTEISQNQDVVIHVALKSNCIDTCMATLVDKINFLEPQLSPQPFSLNLSKFKENCPL